MDDIQDSAFVRPAGLAWSTPSQMVRFAEFLMDGDPAVLDDALRQQMVAEHVNTHFYVDEIQYGYGVFVDRGVYIEPNDYHVMDVYEHGGNTLCFTSILYALPERDFAISILSSGRGTDFSHSLDTAITTLVDLPAPTAAPDFPWDPAGLDDHVGSYMDAYNVGEMIITRQGDTLHIEMPLLDQLGYNVVSAMQPVSTDIWMATIDGAGFDLTFLGDGPGGASLYARNRAFVATRVDERGIAPPEATEAQRKRIDRALAGSPLGPLPVRLEDHHR